MLDVLLSAVIAIATVVIAAAAWLQLRPLAKNVLVLSKQIEQSREADVRTAQERRIWATVAIVERYDTDPVVEGYCERIWEASEGGKNYSSEKLNKRDVIGLLNFFSGIAIGIDQGLYVEEIVKDHLHLSIRKAVENFLHTGICERNGYESLLKLYDKWFPIQTETEFKADRQTL